MIYPVITLYQPWATWIMKEWKTIETRTHDRFASLIHRTVLIHAGLRTERFINNPFLTEEQMFIDSKELVNGAILGSVYVYACGWLCGDNYENKSALIECTDRYGLFLEDIKKFDSPIFCKGSMGIWYFDTDKMKKVIFASTLPSRLEKLSA